MEQIKNSKGEVLPQPYLDLARMRRERGENYIYAAKWANDFNQTKALKYAFDCIENPEGVFWWIDVWEGNYPAIPAASLAELDVWRKEKGLTSNFDGLMEAIRTIPIEERQKIAMEVREKFGEHQNITDWKAMYEQLEAEASELTSTLKELGAKYDELKAGDHTRNWIAECAMAAMQGLLSSPTNYNEYEHPISGKILINPQPEEIAKLSFDYAEAWAAEGRKRGHLPNTENQKA